MLPPSIYIRNLNGQKALLVDPKAIPSGQAMLNPSIAGDWLYIRIQRAQGDHLMNSILMHNQQTKVQREIPSPLARMAPTANSYRGLEDLRLVEHNGRIWFTATATHASPHQCSALMVGFFNMGVTEIEELYWVDVGGLPAKNICPFVAGGKFLLLDTYRHSIYELLCDHDPDAVGPSRIVGMRAVLHRRLVPGPGIPVEGYRGSTSPIHLHGNTWGCVVHIVVFLDASRQGGSKLAYYHVWQEFDLARGVITFMSSPFFVTEHGIEFVSGIRRTATSDGTDAIELYLGVGDKTAVRCTTTLADLRCQK